MYERYCELRDKNGFKDADIANLTGITASTFSDWKRGKSKPNTEKLIKISNILNTNVEYLVTGKDTEKESDSGKKYYFNDETAEMAQELFEDPDRRILMSATRDLSPKDIKWLAETAERLKATNPDG